MVSEKSPRFFYGYRIATAGFFISLTILGAYYSFGVFFKSLLDEFSWDRATTAAAYSLSFFVMSICGVIIGKLSDHFGPRLVVTAGGIIYGLGFILMRWVTQIWQFYLLYGVLIALGMSAAVTPAMAVIPRWFARRRGMMLGVVTAGTGVGSMLVPPFASGLATAAGWRNSYTVIGAAALLITVAAGQFLKLDPAEIGLRQFGAGDPRLTRTMRLNVRNFTLSESLGTGQFWIIGVVNICFSFCQQLILVHIVAHATDMAVPPASAATIMTVIGAGGLAGRLLTGTLIDRTGSRLAMLICFLLLLGGFVELLLARTLGMFYVFAAVFGFAYGGFVTATVPVTAELFGLTSLAAISGSIALVGSPGAIGPVVAGRIYDVSGSYYPGFIISIGLIILGLVLIILLRPITHKEDE